MAMYKGESIVYTLLCEYYGKDKIQINYRPDWLKNPDTGYNLELDFYIESSSIGYEVQGPHHYTDKAQQKRDVTKRRLCKERGVKLVAVRAHRRDFYALRQQLGLVEVVHKKALKYNIPKKKRKRRAKRQPVGSHGRISAGIDAQRRETESILRRKGAANV